MLQAYPGIPIHVVAMATATPIALHVAALQWRVRDGGMGVFAEAALEEGALVECCYSIPLKSVDVPSAELQQRLYDVGDGCLHFPFGWGLLYADASAEKANVTWILEVKEWKGESMHHLCLRTSCAVAAGTELCVCRTAASTAKLDVVSWALSSFEDQGLQLPSVEPGLGAAVNLRGTWRGKKLTIVVLVVIVINTCIFILGNSFFLLLLLSFLQVFSGSDLASATLQSNLFSERVKAGNQNHHAVWVPLMLRDNSRMPPSYLNIIPRK